MIDGKGRIKSIRRIDMTGRIDWIGMIDRSLDRKDWQNR